MKFLTTLFFLFLSLTVFAQGSYQQLPSTSGGGGGGGAVDSVFGRTGVVTAQSGDYTTSKVPEGTRLYYTDARVLAKVASLPESSGCVMCFAETGNDTGIGSPTDGRIDFWINGALKLYLNPDGDLIHDGIFTTNRVQSGEIYTSTGSSSINVNDRRLLKSGDVQTLNYEDKQLNGAWSTDNNFTVENNLQINNGVFNLTYNAEPNNAGGWSGINQQLNLRPLQNSPNDSSNAINIGINLDPDSSGFTIGTSGNAARLVNGNFYHHGTSNIGELNYINFYADIGNGTDPITVKGNSIFFGFGQYHSGVTIDGPIQGYGMQHNYESGTTMSSNAYVNAFYDFNVVHSAIGSYQSFVANPTVDEIKNNSNMTSYSANPTVTTFTGNAGYTGLSLSGTFGTFDTGSWNGIQINPTVTSVNYAQGIFVDMNNVTATTKYAIQTNGDVNINGALTFSGALSMGRLTAFGSCTPINGGGTPQTCNSLISQMTIPANDTTANADFIGLNTAMILSVGANSNITLGAFGLFTSLALPTVIETHTGSTLPAVQGGVFALSFSGTSTGGTISEAAAGRFVLIPNGITTVTESIGVKIDNPFGNPGTTNYGVKQTGAEKNFFEGSLITQGGVQVSTSGSQPTCDASIRGMYWEVQGGAGVKDSTQVCHKDSSNVYGWELVN